MCYYPELIKNPKYRSTKKNGGNIPAVNDERIKTIPIGCGQCIQCLKQRANDWLIRMNEEIKTDTSGKFITLTYSQNSLRELYNYNKKLEGYALDNATAIKSIRLFLERIRKKTKKSIKHWFVTELGGKNTEHLHIHGILWTKLKKEEIEKYWKYGYIHEGKYVNGETIRYITKYIFKKDFKHPNYKPIILTSPGIGKDYTNTIQAKMNKFNERETKEYYRLENGRKIALPIYYRNKIYTEEEREQLWINRLDKNERYIDNKKFNMNNPKEQKEFINRLKHHQELNIRLGYGTNEKNWTEKKYEEQMRALKQLKNKT